MIALGPDDAESEPTMTIFITKQNEPALRVRQSSMVFVIGLCPRKLHHARKIDKHKKWTGSTEVDLLYITEVD